MDLATSQDQPPAQNNGQADTGLSSPGFQNIIIPQVNNPQLNQAMLQQGTVNRMTQNGEK
jgi:hypothetical protein